MKKPVSWTAEAVGRHLLADTSLPFNVLLSQGCHAGWYMVQYTTTGIPSSFDHVERKQFKLLPAFRLQLLSLMFSEIVQKERALY